MAVAATYYDPSGKKQTGYIENGRTYTDENLTQRVPVGSTVETNGGTFKMTGNGGVPNYATAQNIYRQQAEAALGAYREAGQERKNAINAATDAAIAAINKQKKAAERQYLDANRQAQAAYLAASNPYGAAGEQVAKLGLDESGYSETSKLRLAGNYQTQLSENLRQKNATLSELEQAAIEARANGQYQLASAYEAQAQVIAQQKMNIENSLFSSNLQSIESAEASRQFDEQMKQNEKSNKMNLALTWIENGVNPSFAAETLGIPQSDINSLVSAVKAAKVPSAGYSSGSRSNKKATDWSWAVNHYINSGKESFVDWATEFAEAFGLSPEDISEIYGTVQQNMVYKGGPAVPENLPFAEPTEPGITQYGSSFDRIYTVVKNMMFTKQPKSQIEAYLNQFSEEQLTDAGLNYIIDAMGLDTYDSEPFR